MAQPEGAYYLGIACKPGEEESLQRALLNSLWRAHSLLVTKSSINVGLSPREYQIRSRLLAGQTHKEIAYELGLAQATVRVLAMRVRRKMNSEDVRAL